MPIVNRSELAPHRLPRHSKPTRYEIELTPNLAAATFTGTVTIAITTTDHAAELALNAIELEIASCRFDDTETPFDLDAHNERMFVTPPNGVAPGEHRLTIEFTGTLNDDLRGWYRSIYSDDAGQQHVIATTQMQSTDCRRAFPCWDEPNFKAVFAVTLIVDETLLAISNSPEIAAQSTGDGKVRRTFADTMVMSSYLVAFVVGRLETTDPIDVDGTPIRVVHVPGKGVLTEFALDIGTFSLSWFEEYYGIKYPGDKLDLVALPDFAAGAMENLGCITFRENFLLIDPATSTQAERQGVADTVAHEIAHMWFGDLVTMGWWNGIWLNEAFATFMEIAAADAFRPKWERWTGFGLERSVAFETDSLSATRSVEFEVNSPADAEGMFDVLTYQKGGALLRMLEQYLGESVFRDGVRQYLNTHSYGNTDTADLWDAIEAASGEPVRRIMDSWIWQPGYPLVSAALDGDELVLSQRRFGFDRSDGSTLWSVPIAVRVGDDTTTILLKNTSQRLTLSDPNAPVVVNADGHGFFRVAYDETLLGRLTFEVLADLSTLERYTIVDDAWNAVVAGALPAMSYLELVERFAAEKTFGVWQRIAIGLRNIRRLLDDDSAVARFQQRVHRLANPALEHLGEPTADEADLKASLRGLLLGLVAIQGGDDEAVARARDYYDRWEADPASIDAELAAAATSIIANIGDQADYERFVSQFETTDNPQDRIRHLYALSEFDDATLMERTCQYCMTSSVRTQNAPFVLARCIANRTAGWQAWEFVRDRWDQANERFPRNSIIRMVDTVKLLDRPEQVQNVAEFFADHPLEQAAKTLQQILERQSVNAALRTRESPALQERL